jgi:outer membrane biosynthesis protein TonB
VVRQDGNYDEGFSRNIVVANTTPPTPTPTDTPAFDVEATLPPPIESVVTPTPAATPTPAVIEQPEIPTPTPRPSPSPTVTPDQNEQPVAVDSGAAGDSSAGNPLTDALETSTLQSSFVRGASLAAAIFLAVGAFFGVRRLLTWLWYLIAP